MSSTSTSEALKPGFPASPSLRSPAPSSPPATTASARKPTSATSSRVRQQQYLIVYNLVSALLWFAVLARVLILVVLVGYRNVYGGVGEFARWVQTGAGLEIVHAGIGLVRSPISTTAIQVTSRLVLVHLIVHPFPGSTTISPFYTSMLLAWSASEVIRYSYFVQTLRGADPGPLTWLRYNTFYVLYPVGIASEMANIYLATGEMEGWERLGAWIVLGIYVPGSYIMYTHMMKQRRRQSKGKAPIRRNRVDSLQQ